MRACEPELVLDARAERGGCPRWEADAERLLFGDTVRGRVHSFRPGERGCRNVAVGRPVGAVQAFDGGLILAVQGGFARLGPGAAGFEMIAAAGPEEPGIRMNDGACDAAGRFWAGTTALDERPGVGALYRLDADGGVHRMLDGVAVSSGLDWSRDGARMY